MDKIRIKNLRQSRHKMRDNTYAVGLETIWGTVWITKRGIARFLAQNKHLEDIISQGTINGEELIGKYIWVRDKCKGVFYDGNYFTYPFV